jgi:hypothetical protein
MSIIGTAHGKLLVMVFSVAMIAAFGGSLAYGQTAQGLGQSLQLVQGGSFQIPGGTMFGIGQGGIGPTVMCHGNMSYSVTPGISPQ